MLDEVTERADGSIIARCPVCAEAGGDSQGVHLIVYPNGAYACVAHVGDRDHSREIYRIAGDGHFEPKKASKPKRILHRGLMNYEEWFKRKN